jgi:hypothetical protein
MGKRGKSAWDEAMIASGHRTADKQNKKWASRLRGNIKNTSKLDDITREQVDFLLFVYKD